MGAIEFTSVVLMLSTFAITINADCSNEDLESKLFRCRDQADVIINSNQCSGIETKVGSIFNCFSGCEAIPSAFADELTKLMDSINTAVGSRCNDQSSSVDARDGRPASACDIAGIFSCVTNLGSVINIPTNADLSSLRGVCGTIDSIVGFLNTCGNVVVDCISLTGDTFKNEMDQIRRGLKIGNELQKGGCTCITEIESSVNAYANLPQDEGALQLICPIVQETTSAVKTVMDTCIARINSAVEGPTLDWLTITIDYINIVNPFVILVCGTNDSIRNAAVTISLGLLTAVAAGLLHFWRRIR